MKLKFLYILILSALIYSCDDSTTGIGDSTIANGDPIPAGTKFEDLPDTFACPICGVSKEEFSLK